MDFTVKLIYQHFLRCPVSRGCIKLPHKKSCLSVSTGQHLQATVVLFQETIRSISHVECVQRISDNPEAFVIDCNECKTQKNRKTMTCSHTLHTEDSKDGVFRS